MEWTTILLYVLISSIIVIGLIAIAMTIRHVYRFKGEAIFFPKAEDADKN